MKTILVLCTANICRSPMAEGLLRRKIEQAGLTDQLTVHSAGVFAEEGSMVSANSVKALALLDIDIAAHRSHTVTAAALRQADVILVMEEAHRRSVFYEYPQALPKTFLFGELAGQYEDVADPFGSDLSAYQACAANLSRLIEQGFPQLLKQLGLEAKQLC